MSTKNEIKLHKQAIELQYYGSWYFAIKDRKIEMELKSKMSNNFGVNKDKIEK